MAAAAVLPLAATEGPIQRFVPTVDAIIIEARLTASPAICPCCGVAASRRQRQYQRTLADLPWQGLPVVVRLVVRLVGVGDIGGALVPITRLGQRRRLRLVRVERPPSSSHDCLAVFSWCWEFGLSCPLLRLLLRRSVLCDRDTEVTGAQGLYQGCRAIAR